MGQLMNPESSLEKRNVPQRVMADRNRREAFTQQLKEIRLASSAAVACGTTRGRCWPTTCSISHSIWYGRIAAWQHDFDETENPPATGDDAWWDRHEQEEIVRNSAQAAGIESCRQTLPQGWLVEYR